jgi:hypothetical protein
MRRNVWGAVKKLVLATGSMSEEPALEMPSASLMVAPTVGNTLKNMLDHICIGKRRRGTWQRLMHLLRNSVGITAILSSGCWKG